MKIEFSDAAKSDLRSIRDYTLYRWGEVQEEQYLAGLWEKFEEISENPGRWRFRRDLSARCQLCAYEKHVILFRVEENSLEIARILHSSMDFKRHLFD